jgi:prepilin-type processing-associated H-X9-DG protein
MIEFTCTCGKPLQADEQHAGRMTRCPACGREQPIPARDGAIRGDAPEDRGSARPTDFQGEPGRRREAGRRESDRPPAPQTSGKAVAALVLGLLSFGMLCLAGVPAFVLGVLALMDISKSEGRLGGKVLAILGMVMSVLSLLCIGPVVGLGGYFGYGFVRGESNRQQSKNNLYQLGLAMHSYNDTYNSLPPAQGFAPGVGVPGGPGGFPGPPGAPGTRPKVSWRVLILPYIEHDNLYKMYHFDEPWDGPNNSKLLTMMPKAYQLPGDTTAPLGHTYYQVFVSAPSAVPHALFSTDPSQRVRITDIVDGTSNTLMIVEAATPVPWTKPDDIPFDPNGPAPQLGKHYNGGCNAALADGSVRFLPGNLSPTTLKALITRDGGEVVAGPDF